MVQFYKAPKRTTQLKSEKNSTLKSKSKMNNIQMDTFDHAANGVCLSTQPITIVEYALPNERCDLVIKKETKHARFARVQKVLEANPQRQKPFCEYYDKCGGCGLQHTNAEYGLSIKNQALKTYLHKQSNIKQDTWLAPITSNYPEYRRRIRLAVDARAFMSAGAATSGVKAKIGYRSVQSSKIVDIPYCAIARPGINKVLEALHSQLTSNPGMKQVGHIVITQGSNIVQLALFLTGTLPKSAKQVLLNIAQKLEVQVCLLTKQKKPRENEQYSESYDKEIIGAFTENVELTTLLSELSGEDLQNSCVDSTTLNTFPDQKAITLNVLPTHFMQVNEKVNQQMLRLARTWINTYQDKAKSQVSIDQASPILYDFFCGAGNFSLVLADLCKTVYAFEGVEEMVHSAASNAILNHVNNCEFKHADLNNKAQLERIEFAENAIVVLDPSREGAQNLTQVLSNKRLAMIIYVSCNPNSFARDIKQLNAQYDVQEICALDMFPYTKHIGLMAKLVPR
jgi:23S rRNA (uracil1939-C5)-methyltransferase